MNAERLQALAQTPRQITPELKKIRSKPFFFLFTAIKKWEAGLTRGPLVLGYVIQANRRLFDPNDSAYAPAVVIYATDPKIGLDGNWITALGQRIAQAKDTPSGDEMIDAMAAFLRAETSKWDIDVPRGATDNVPVRMAVHRLAGAYFPGGCVPPHRLVPLLLFPDGPSVIPGALYT